MTPSAIARPYQILLCSYVTPAPPLRALYEPSVNMMSVPPSASAGGRSWRGGSGAGCIGASVKVARVACRIDWAALKAGSGRCIVLEDTNSTSLSSLSESEQRSITGWGSFGRLGGSISSRERSMKSGCVAKVSLGGGGEAFLAGGGAGGVVVAVVVEISALGGSFEGELPISCVVDVVVCEVCSGEVLCSRQQPATPAHIF